MHVISHGAQILDENTAAIAKLRGDSNVSLPGKLRA